MLYPLCVHRIIKVHSILYQKFALWTFSPFRHEVSLLYFSRNILFRVLANVCIGIVISNVFNLNKYFFLFLFINAYDADNKKAVDLIYLDFQNPFDKVPHERLLEKVMAHGI